MLPSFEESDSTAHVVYCVDNGVFVQVLICNGSLKLIAIKPGMQVAVAYVMEDDYIFEDCFPFQRYR